jgi:hypothetical protein
MFSFKKSLVGLLGLLLIVGALAALLPLVGRGQGGVNPLTRDPRKAFYLTQTTHLGDEVLTACAEGYHMASLWEILDPSNFKYNTTLGAVRGDSGAGPPANSHGWIRTGNDASTGNFIVINCRAWTTIHLDFGPVAWLDSEWSSAARNISPWQTSSSDCNISNAVWCAEN